MWTIKKGNIGFFNLFIGNTFSNKVTFKTGVIGSKKTIIQILFQCHTKDLFVEQTNPTNVCLNLQGLVFWICCVNLTYSSPSCFRIRSNSGSNNVFTLSYSFALFYSFFWIARHSSTRCGFRSPVWSCWRTYTSIMCYFTRWRPSKWFFWLQSKKLTKQN